MPAKLLKTTILTGHILQPPSMARRPEEGVNMKGMIFAVPILVCLLAGSGCMTGGYTTVENGSGAGPDSLALTRHDIIAMSQAKVGDDVIIKMIQSTDSRFRLQSRDVVALADSGVSDKVIEAMISTANAPARKGERYYYYPAYYPPYYWWGAYPYYYPWSFGLSVGFYAPYYNHRYYAPHYGYGTSHYYYGSHPYGAYPSGGGRSISISRSSGRHR
jgi:hypothetical protein